MLDPQTMDSPWLTPSTSDSSVIWLCSHIEFGELSRDNAAINGEAYKRLQKGCHSPVHRICSLYWLDEPTKNDAQKKQNWRLRKTWWCKKQPIWYQNKQTYKGAKCMAGPQTFGTKWAHFKKIWPEREHFGRPIKKAHRVWAQVLFSFPFLAQKWQ